jgi:hypothetical protein
VLVVFALLLLVFLVVTQIVLWTNIPRDLVLDKLQRQLGLRITAQSLSTGWLGNTNLRDVSIALPLSDEALLRVPRMRVKHTTLFGLLLTQAVELDEIDLNDASVLVRQDVTGRWNLQEVADLLARAGGKQTAQEQAGGASSRPKLPALRINHATIDVLDRTGRKTAITPISVTGDPENAITWKYEAVAGNLGGIGPQIALSGRLVTGGTWEHQLKLFAVNVQQWASTWTGPTSQAVSFAGDWHGSLRADGVAGRLVIAGLQIGDFRLSGALGANKEGSAVAIRPENLFVHTPRKEVPDVRISAGKLWLDAKSVAADGLTLTMFDGAARIDGRYDWSAGSADVTTTWANFEVPNQQVTYGGTFNASLRSPITGRQIDAHLVSAGTFPTGGWNTDLTLHGTGRAMDHMDWSLAAKRLSIDSVQPIRLDGLAAGVQTRGKLVSLTSLRGPGEVVARGDGRYDLASEDWNVHLDLSNIPRPLKFGKQTPLAITLRASGTRDRIALENPGLSLRGPEAELRLDGTYVYRDPKPVNLTVRMNNVPQRQNLTTPDNEPPPLFAYLRGEAQVIGTVLHPRDLEVTGFLIGREVRLLDRPLGDFDTRFRGTIDDKTLSLNTEKTELLGGQWVLQATFPKNAALDMNLAVDGLPLTKVGEALKLNDIDGLLNAKLAIVVPRLKVEALRINGDVKGSSLKYGKLSADSLEGKISVADGQLRAQPVRLRKADGEAHVTAEMDLREYRRVMASIDFASWPFEPQAGTRAQLWGGTDGLRITFPGAKRQEGIRGNVYRPESRAERLWVTGPIDIRANFTLENQPLGQAKLLADVRGRSLDLRSLSFDGLDGTVQGQAVVDFDHPLTMRGSLYFEDFNGARIPEFFPKNPVLKGLSGRYSGDVRIGPAPGPRPLQPLRIVGHVTNVAGKYRTIDVGPIQFSAFTNLDRVVIEDSPKDPTTIALAGGLVRVWGRFSVLEPGEELSAAASRRIVISQMQVLFKTLDLNQIVHAFKPDADRMVGKLAGSFEALAGTRPGRAPGAEPSGQNLPEKIVRRITADGRVELTQSELGNLDVVAALYNAMSIAPDPDNPEGRGDLTFHLEDGSILLNNIHYFNRGSEMRGIVKVDEIWKLPASPVSGTAVGTARPFRDIRLPFLSTYDLDTILTVLQTDLTTVGVRGTVHQPEIVPLAFSDLGDAMRMFILGDFDRENPQAKPKY